MTTAFITDIKDDGKLPDRIMLVGQMLQGLEGRDTAPGPSIYEHFLSDEARLIQERLRISRKRCDPAEWMRADRREFDRLRARDLQAVLARFPDYEVRPPSFAGDISLYRK